MPKSFIVLPNLVTLTEKVEHICLSLVKAELLSAAKGQRPRNYLSCCWIVRLVNALSTHTTVLHHFLP